MLIALQLGGSVFHLCEPRDYPLLAWPIHPFDEFLAPSNVPPDFRIDVTVVPHLPELEAGLLRFDAGQGFWKLFESDAGFVIESISPKILQPRARALVSHDYRTIRAWVLPEMHLGQVGWSPMHLFNPIVEVCLLSRLALDGGLLLHAAGLMIQEEGYIFTGNSGTGKSTIAQFFAERGALVLSDERLIIRKIADDVLFYGTPWVGSGNYAHNAQAPLSQLYCISHGAGQHTISPLSPRAVSQELLRQCFLPLWNRDALEATLATVTDLVQQIHCRALAALKSPDVVDVVLAQRQLSPIGSR
jgi:hypothetical protein